jgi:hypothetical protein
MPAAGRRAAPRTTRSRVCSGVPDPARDAAPPGLRPLPAVAARLLRDLDPPPRLVAHLALVHAAAADLAGRLTVRWPSLPLDREALLVGAATHDVGKAMHRDELTGPGTRHEAAGEQLLLGHGFPPERPRFARTHGGPDRGTGLTLEDWAVMVADAVWKGARHRGSGGRSGRRRRQSNWHARVGGLRCARRDPHADRRWRRRATSLARRATAVVSGLRPARVRRPRAATVAP